MWKKMFFAKYRRKCFWVNIIRVSKALSNNDHRRFAQGQKNECAYRDVLEVLLS